VTMADDSIAVSLRNVSKMYRLFDSPKARMLEALHPFRKKYHREFWALRDITLDIPRGITLGIVGRNGSGKSTLLQLVCSVLSPTTGTVEVRGRVAALLELGAGFNPEFTGRDNAIFSGILAGFSRQEIEERLPEIEAFADIGQFFYQPVRTYSSGMSVRLAFAAASCIDPDILVVDEALSVGDAKFQQKCYAKLRGFQESGKTVLFVTHSIDAVVRHCHQAMLLDRGEMVDIGEPKPITNYYTEILFAEEPSRDHMQCPVVIKKGYRGFNLIRYGLKHYAVSETVEGVDPAAPSVSEMLMLEDSGKVLVADAYRKLIAMVDGATPESLDGSTSGGPSSEEAGPNTLSFFLDDTPTGDHCQLRKSYNKNEHRVCDGRAEIVDYLVFCQGETDPISVVSGEWVDIYAKVSFNVRVEKPVFSFGVRSVDGLVLFATNSDHAKLSIVPVGKGEVVVFKFGIKLHLQAGDYFLGMDCSEIAYGSRVPIDYRSGLIHLRIIQQEVFGGIVKFETDLREVKRRSLSGVSS